MLSVNNELVDLLNFDIDNWKLKTKCAVGKLWIATPTYVSSEISSNQDIQTTSNNCHKSLVTLKKNCTETQRRWHVMVSLTFEYTKQNHLDKTWYWRCLWSYHVVKLLSLSESKCLVSTKVVRHKHGRLRTVPAYRRETQTVDQTRIASARTLLRIAEINT